VELFIILSFFSDPSGASSAEGGQGGGPGNRRRRLKEDIRAYLTRK